MDNKDIIAQPLTLRNGLQIKNRLVKSAMSEALGDSERAPTELLSNLYKVWAEGGIGLNITGNVMIDSRYISEPGNVVIENEDNLDMLTAWAKASLLNGANCWVQLNHPGKQSPRGLNKENVAPSAIPFRKEMKSYFTTPRALEEDEIWDLIHRFGNAARIVKKAGFTGVQIHGAHGYLVGQFLSPLHNIRTDKWGGNAENRRRFVVEVFKSIRKNVGNDFAISIKLNSADFQRGGFTEEESLDVIRALDDAGIDMIEISGGTYEAPAMTGIRQKESTRQREAYFMDFAEKARKTTKVPLMLTGGFRTIEGMASAISSGAIDFVGLGRSLVLEPNLPNELLNGIEPEHIVKPIKTGISMVDRMGIMEVAWYSEQIRRISKGYEPDISRHPLKTLMNLGLKMVKGNKVFSRLRAS